MTRERAKIMLDETNSIGDRWCHALIMETFGCSNFKRGINDNKRNTR